MPGRPRGRAPAWCALLVLALGAAGPVAPATAASPAPHRLAVIASQNAGGPGTATLRYADADAAKVRDVLVDLGGFERQGVRLVADAGRAELLATLAEVSRRAAILSAAGEPVLLLVYYSGHADRDGLMLGRARVGYDEIDRLVEASGAQVRLQLYDACHAGVATRGKGATAVPSFLIDVDEALSSAGRVVITSSAADEVSQESDAIGGSYFTHFLVSGLRGAADDDGDGRVTLDELYRHLYDETLYHTASSRSGPQHPAYDYDLTGRGAIVLADLQTTTAALVFPADAEGRYTVFHRGSRSFVGELAGAAEPVRLAVAPGTYIVQRRAGDELRAAEVVLGQGDEVDVDGLAMVDRAFDDDIAKGLSLRWRRRSRAVIRAGGGLHAVPGPALREEYFPTMGLVNVAAGVEWRGHPRTELLADVSFGRARYVVEGAYYGGAVTETHWDVGASYRLVEDLSGFRLALGPRFAMLTYHRSPPGDSLAGFSLGIDAGVGFRVRQRAGLALDVRAGYLLNDTAMEDQSHAHLQALLRFDVAL